MASRLDQSTLVATLHRIRSEATTLLEQQTKSPDAIEEPEALPFDDPLIISRQKELYAFYDLFGIVGVCYWIDQIAKWEREDEIRQGVNRKRAAADSDDEDDESGGHKSWSKVTTDYKRGPDSRMYFMMSSLHPDSIPAIIRGDLPSRMQNPEFAAAVGPHVQPVETQGTYAVYMAKSSPNDSIRGGSGEYTGYGLSMSQLIQVVDTMKDYTKVGTTASTNLAKRIDAQKGGFNARKLDYKCQRRYGSGDGRASLSTIRKWLDNFDHVFLYDARMKANENAQDRELAMFLLRCLVYVGLSCNVKRRALSHPTQTGSESRLLGLLSATVKYLFNDEFNIDKFTYQIFKTVRDDDIGLDEIVQGLMSTAHHWDCGLNVGHCGGSLGGTTDRDSDFHIQGLKQNAGSIRQSGHQELNIQDAADKIDRVKACLKFWSTRESASVEERKDLNHILDQTKLWEQEIEDLEEYDALATAIQNLESSHPTAS